MMKKQIILILFLLGNLTTSFSKSHNNTFTNSKTAFDELVGTYNGFPVTEEGIDNSNKIIAELTADFNFKITENFDGLLVEHFNEKLSPQAGGLTKRGEYLFEFKTESGKSEYKVVRILIHPEAIIPNTNFSMSIAMLKKSDEVSVFAIKKEGGNPKMPSKNIEFSDIYESVFYTGKTQDNTFGDYKIEWYPSQGMGYLSYKNVINVFKIERKKNKYRLTNKYDIDLEYIYNDWSQKDIKLLDIHSGKNLLKKNVKYGRNAEGVVVGNEKAFLIKVGASFYDAIHDRFKPKENYTLTHDNKSNGKGIAILSEDKIFAVYAGDLKDGIIHGKGSTIQESESSRGLFQNGERHGYTEVTLSSGGSGSGKFINGVQEGLWKIKLATGATFDKVFEDGKQISSTATNTGIKNTQIAKHVDDAEYQLKSAKRLYSEFGDISSRCGERTTLKSYQSCYRTLKPKIDAFSVGIVAGIRELEKAKKEAEKSKCAQTLQVLKNAEDNLWEANGALGDAYKAATEVYHATTVAMAKAENGKCIDAINKSVDAMNDYKVWITSPITQECYTYTTTENSTLPLRTSSTNKASRKSTTSDFSKNKTTPQNKNTPKKTTAVPSRAVTYPPFSGKYEGDNLLLLMGRKVDDPAVQKLLKNPSYEFEKIDRSGSLREKIDYNCSPYRFSLSFVNGVMTYISFEVKEWDNKNYFKKKLPLNIPLAKATSAMKRMNDKWEHNDYGNSSNWTLKKYQLKFNVWGGGENNDIHIVNINAEDITDWNSYYQQFQ